MRTYSLHPIVATPDVRGHLQRSAELNATTEADYVRLVEAFTRATLQNDIEQVMSYVAEDVEYWNLPDPLPRRGRAAARAFLEPIWMDPTNVYFAYKIFRTLVSGRTVFHERVDIFKRGEHYLEVPIAGVYIFNDQNEVCVWRDYFDTAPFTDIMNHLDLPAPKGPAASPGGLWDSNWDGYEIAAQQQIP
jgi:limonene-1,2-epoxide hydrolase